MCDDAAESGNAEMLLYLMQLGCPFHADTMVSAAQRGHLAACQLLVAEGCPCDTDACAYAAANGHLETVRFLHESGCPWDATIMCGRAARSGNVELMRYLKQQGCAISEGVMNIAAERGFVQVCQFLRTEQCPWSSQTCLKAVQGNHLSTLRWLHKQGCPWDVHAVRTTATTLLHLPALRYMLSVAPAASAGQLTELLNVAGSSSRFAAAHLLRQQGAEWPAELGVSGRRWGARALQWARDAGCTSPVSATNTASLLPNI
jgi:hypothetical protein